MQEPADSITVKVAGLIEPVMEEMGFELVDIEYLMERGRWVLRVYADKEGGIMLDDCAQVSREIGDLMDGKDQLEHPYVLEVSSPGLDRPLKKEKDFLRAIGKKVKVRTAAPVEGQQNFTGYLRHFQDGTLELELEDKRVFLPRQEVQKANLVFEFEN